MAHGPTWHRTVDPLLEHISRINTERSNALDELTAFLLDHPEYEDDPRLTTARLALL